jgi:hypothetical protein
MRARGRGRSSGSGSSCCHSTQKTKNSVEGEELVSATAFRYVRVPCDQPYSVRPVLLSRPFRCYRREHLIVEMKNPLLIVPLPASVQVEPFASFECSRPLEPELVEECVTEV